MMESTKLDQADVVNDKRISSLPQYLWMDVILFVLRIFVMPILSVAAMVQLTASGNNFNAIITYSPAFMFLLYANVFVAAYWVAFSPLIIWTTCHRSPCYFYFYLQYLLDMIIMVLIVSSSIAATISYYVSVNENHQNGWRPVSDDRDALSTRRVVENLKLSYLSSFFLLAISIISADKLDRMEASPATAKIVPESGEDMI